MTLRLVIPSWDEVDSELSVAHPWWRFSAHFNVAISQSIPVARMYEHETEGVMMRWGLAQKSVRGDVEFTNCGLVRSDSLRSAQDIRAIWLSIANARHCTNRRKGAFISGNALQADIISPTTAVW